MSGMRKGYAPPTVMMRMPTIAAGLKPTFGSSAPEMMLTGTDTMPVMLFASMIVVMSVSAK